ncbi:uncharacterized protein LOC117301153 [Asterias rubens]|uniref:uncharacterized protein LOC117301153 n=1 Tax=Asterias rubens TaxID=7604 RepID=UPI001454E911|nr:uncharacterized protein LOC117301153 [Asterias rubens]
MDDLRDPQSFGVFFSNLEDDIPKMEIVAMIISLIFQATGIRVQENDFSMRHSKPSRCNIANVNLHDLELQRRTVKALQQLSNHYIPKGLVKSGRTLRVDYFQSNNLPRAPMSQPSKNQTNENTCLVKYQQMGNETRSLEFKRGGNILEKYMRKVLSRYVCGFLNSEGGQLMIGVDDEGFVQGVQCNHKIEDSFRIMFDQLIHMFDPPVLPPMYRLDFIPVRDDRDRMTDLKVVAIDVKAGHSNMLYETPEGEVFIRRDGSVQGPLRAKDVQAWCRLKISEENQDKERLLKHQIDVLEMRLQNAEWTQGQEVQTEQIERSQGHRGQIERSQGHGGQTDEKIERSQGQGGQTEQLEMSKGQGGQTEQLEMSKGQGGQTEQTLHRSVPTNSLGARLSPTMSSQVEHYKGLKRTNSKFCAIL